MIIDSCFTENCVRNYSRFYKKDCTKCLKLNIQSFVLHGSRLSNALLWLVQVPACRLVVVVWFAKVKLEVRYTFKQEAGKFSLIFIAYVRVLMGKNQWNGSITDSIASQKYPWRAKVQVYMLAQHVVIIQYKSIIRSNEFRSMTARQCNVERSFINYNAPLNFNNSAQITRSICLRNPGMC